MRKICIIGGGAAGLTAAVLLARAGKQVTVLERGDRVGRKLAASGNGQGNVTNLDLSPAHYFSDDPEKVARLLARFGTEEILSFLTSMGGVFLPDARGRVYPAGRMASAVTDLFRRELERLHVSIVYGARVREISWENSFTLTFDGGSMSADGVLLAAGGRAAEHFLTDGTAYALAEKFGHTVAPLSPVLVRLRTDPALVKSLKGIRIDAALSVLRGGRPVYQTRGDVLFCEGGVSGDAVFRASSYTQKGDALSLDLVPDAAPSALRAALSRGTGEDKLLCVVPNGLGRALYRMGSGEEALLARLKDFRLPVLGDFGFSGAQATRGGIPLAETDETLQSKHRKGLFFAGEILNTDGECGGYNLHWAFASAHAAAGGMTC